MLKSKKNEENEMKQAINKNELIGLYICYEYELLGGFQYDISTYAKIRKC